MPCNFLSFEIHSLNILSCNAFEYFTISEHFFFTLIISIQDHESKMSDEHRDTDDSSEKTPSRMSRSPQKSSKRPKTVPVKVTLLDGSAYETGVEVQ